MVELTQKDLGRLTRTIRHGDVRLAQKIGTGASPVLGNRMFYERKPGGGAPAPQAPKPN